MKHSFQLVIVGEERSGKSYWTKHYADIYCKVRGSVIVYNSGRETDFPEPEYNLIEPLSFNEHLDLFHNGKDQRKKYLRNSSIEYFRFNGKISHFRDFNKMFFKKKVKVNRFRNKKEETAFIECVHRYISRCFFILDDCRSIFRHGLNGVHEFVFSTKNHAGKYTSTDELKGKGIDLGFIFHNIDHVNTILWDWTTSIINLKYPIQPNCKKFENPALEKTILAVHKKLMNSKKWTAIEIPLRGDNYLKPRYATISN